MEVDAPSPPVADDGALIAAAALDGIGLAPVHEGPVADRMACGEPVRVLEDRCPVLPPFFLRYPGRRQVPAPLRAFIDMLRTEPG